MQGHHESKNNLVQNEANIDIHWKPAHALSSAEAASELFSLGPSIESMLKRSVAKSTVGGETSGLDSTACFAGSVDVTIGSDFWMIC